MCTILRTQNMEHPRAPRVRDIVRMDVFWSMWRSRTIPCPHGSGRPACETVLLHHEQFKIPENLARFAVRHGMTRFVQKMGPAVQEFVAERRKRISPVRSLPLSAVGRLHTQACTERTSHGSPAPCGTRHASLMWDDMPCCVQFDDDPEAYGVTGTPNPPSRTASVASTMSDIGSETSSEAGSSEPASPSSAAGAPRKQRRSASDMRQQRAGPVGRLARINGAVIAFGVAFALGRSSSRGKLAA